jgi:hypothetical protein
MTATEYPACGVDTAGLLATPDAVEANPDIARFQFRASNTSVSRTHVQIPRRQS